MVLKKRIIPCLDVKDGRVVKGINFVDLVDAGDPVENALRYDKEGADEIVFLDITASSDNRAILLNVVERTAKNIFIPLTVGGGIRKIEDIRNLLNAGADKVAINSAAVKDPDLIQEASSRFGSQCIVIAIDAKSISRFPSGYGVFLNGGREQTEWDALEWSKEAEKRGAGEILLTSMDRDGTKIGYDLDLTKRVSNSITVPVIASGGVGNLEHLADGLIKGDASAVLAASIFHFGIYSIAEAKTYLHKKGIPVRLD